MSETLAVVIAAFIKGFFEMGKRFALVHPIWFSFPVEKRVSRLFRNLGAIVVVYVTCVWWRLAHQEICKFTFYRLESGTESVVLMVDCMTFCFLCTQGCQRRS